MTEERKVSRRNFLGYAVTAIVAGVVAGVGGYYAGLLGAPAGPVATTTVTQPVTTTVTSGAGVTTTTVTQPITTTVTRSVTTTATTTTAPVPEKTLRVGVMHALTGPISPENIPANDAFSLALEEINSSGGIVVGGTRYKIEVITYDAWEPDGAKKAFERLVTVDKVKMIWDGVLSDSYYSLGPTLKDVDVVLMWASGTDPNATIGVPNAFRICSDIDKYIFPQDLQFLKEQGIKTVCGIAIKGHTDFKDVPVYQPGSGFNVLSMDYVDMGATDFFPVLTKVKDLKPDCVYCHSIPIDSVEMAKQAVQIGLLPGPMYMVQDFKSPDIAASMLNDPEIKALEGTYQSMLTCYTITANPPAQNQDFIRRYKQRYGEGAMLVALNDPFYDGVYALLKGVEKAGTVDDVPKIIDALHEVRSEEIPQLLQKYPPGKIFDENGQANPKVFIGKYTGGKMIVVKES